MKKLINNINSLDKIINIMFERLAIIIIQSRTRKIANQPKKENKINLQDDPIFWHWVLMN